MCQVPSIGSCHGLGQWRMDGSSRPCKMALRGQLPGLSGPRTGMRQSGRTHSHAPRAYATRQADEAAGHFVDQQRKQPAQPEQCRDHGRRRRQSRRYLCLKQCPEGDRRERHQIVAGHRARVGGAASLMARSIGVSAYAWPEGCMEAPPSKVVAPLHRFAAALESGPGRSSPTLLSLSPTLPSLLRRWISMRRSKIGTAVRQASACAQAAWFSP